MGTETKAVDRQSGYLFLLLLVYQYSLSTLVCMELVAADLPEMPDLLETLPKSSPG
jgi:hypothetical protein